MVLRVIRIKMSGLALRRGACVWAFVTRRNWKRETVAIDVAKGRVHYVRRGAEGVCRLFVSLVFSRGQKLLIDDMRVLDLTMPSLFHCDEIWQM